MPGHGVSSRSACFSQTNRQAETARAKLKLPRPVAPKAVELPKPAPAAAAVEAESAPAAEAVSEG